MKTKYLIFSHHPKERNTSPCTTVYNVFLGTKSAYPNAEYIFIKLPKKEFRKELTEKIDENIVLLFNGCGSLMNENALYAIDYAKRKNLPVVVYWHETAWMLNDWMLTYNSSKYWVKIEKLLHESNVKHWVPFSQAKQLIMYIFKRNYEDVLIVHEAINLEKYVPINRIDFKENIKIIGAGVINYNKNIFWRKGTDYFCIISQNLSHINGVNCHFHWFGGSKKDISNYNVSIPENCDFLGFVDDFYSKIRNYDIFLLTSRDDPSPIVAFEALACDLPVFCFDSVGTREVIPSEFVASDIDEMIDNIVKYCNNKQKYPPNYFRKIAEKYSPEKFVEKIHKEQTLLPIDNFSYSRKHLTQRLWARLKNYSFF